jgi:hypothetical protein
MEIRLCSARVPFHTSCQIWRLDEFSNPRCYLESRAIAVYSAAKWKTSGESLIPEATNPGDIGLFAQALSAELTQFDQLAEPFVLKHVIAK